MYRMRQLCEKTGMTRQAIHFYIKKGLVPPGIKHGKTSAEYTDEHVERILLVRRMREEQFLPLDAIRATFDSRDQGFSPAQRRVLSDVRRKFSTVEVPRRQRPTLALATVARRSEVSVDDVQELIDEGLVSAAPDEEGDIRIDREDVWLLECWGELVKLGLGRDRGLSPKDLRMYRLGVEAILQAEAHLLTRQLEDLDGSEIAEMVERALPVISTLLTRMHDRAVREFLKQL